MTISVKKKIFKTSKFNNKLKINRILNNGKTNAHDCIYCQNQDILVTVADTELEVGQHNMMAC